MVCGYEELSMHEVWNRQQVQEDDGNAQGRNTWQRIWKMGKVIHGKTWYGEKHWTSRERFLLAGNAVGMRNKEWDNYWIVAGGSKWAQKSMENSCNEFRFLKKARFSANESGRILQITQRRWQLGSTFRQSHRKTGWVRFVFLVEKLTDRQNSKGGCILEEYDDKAKLDPSKNWVFSTLKEALALIWKCPARKTLRSYIGWARALTKFKIVDKLRRSTPSFWKTIQTMRHQLRISSTVLCSRKVPNQVDVYFPKKKAFLPKWIFNEEKKHGMCKH